jgi:hypothetical protein
MLQRNRCESKQTLTVILSPNARSSCTRIQKQHLTSQAVCLSCVPPPPPFPPLTCNLINLPASLCSLPEKPGHLLGKPVLTPKTKVGHCTCPHFWARKTHWGWGTKQLAFPVGRTRIHRGSAHLISYSLWQNCLSCELSWTSWMGMSLHIRVGEKPRILYSDTLISEELWVLLAGRKQQPTLKSGIFSANVRNVDIYHLTFWTYF